MGCVFDYCLILECRNYDVRTWNNPWGCWRSSNISIWRTESGADVWHWQVRSLRMCGSCAMDLCGLACGRLDLFYELGFGGPWWVNEFSCHLLQAILDLHVLHDWGGVGVQLWLREQSRVPHALWWPHYMEQGCCSRCFDTGRGRGACIWPVSFLLGLLLLSLWNLWWFQESSSLVGPNNQLSLGRRDCCSATVLLAHPLIIWPWGLQ